MDYFSEKYKRIALISFFSFVVAFSLVLIYISVKFDKNKTPSQNTNESQQIYSSLPPAPDFENWTENEKSSINTAQLNNQSTFYTFKTEYTSQEMDQLSSLLKVNPETEADGYSVFTNYATNSANLLLFKKTTGDLSYSSTNGIPLVSKIDVPNQILEVVKKMGFYDSSIKIMASYKRRSIPGVTYYELHRDWKETGYPIFNPVGLLNVPENEVLKNISFTTRDENFKDTDIYDSSDLNNAYARKTDFNSMTVVVDENSNSIVNIVSNIRPITVTNKVVSKTELLTKDEALEKLKKGEQEIFLTTPSGEGITDFRKVYPNNRAAGKEAVIEESIIAYLENTKTNQTNLEPYYLFKGYSELNSGYRVRFIAAVSAIKNNNVAGAFIAATAPGLGGQQQNTLTFPSGKRVSVTPTQNPTKKPMITSEVNPNITTKPFNNKNCKPSEKDFLMIVEFNGLKYGYFVKGSGPGTNWVYLIPENTITIEKNKLLNIIAEFKKHTGANNFVSFDGKFGNSSQATLPSCPFVVTGWSPSIFLYGKENTEFNLSINHNLTYADPGIQKKEWDITTKKDNLLVNNKLRNFIYYEYESVPFLQPEKGWMIERNNLNSFIETISSQLKLTSSEKSRLTFEIQHASIDIHDNYVFIGLIPQSEIDEKLPLIVSPKVETMYRYHFYLKGMNNKIEVKAPSIKQIKRSETMIVEFGAINAQ